MTTPRWPRGLALFAVLIALALVQAARAAAQSSEWTTDFGPLVLTVRDGDRVTGVYPSYNGRIEATLNRRDSALEGLWLQPSSEVRCDQARDGTHSWGLVSWSLRQDGTLQGQWSYCGNPPGSAGVWNGTFVTGTHPMDTGREQARVKPQAPAPTPAPVPPQHASGGSHGEPGPDAMEAARFLWGQYADPSRLKVLREDITCDARADLVLVYLDLDSPDGPFLSIAVRETGATLEQIPATYLDFDTGTFASLCGPGRMVDVSVVGDLDPDTVLDLTGFSSPPACRVGLRLDDGMCDSVWVFTMPGQNGLSDLIIGRN
jgi:hypothetical protein